MRQCITGVTLGMALLFAISMCQATIAKAAQEQSGAKTFSGYVMDSACAQMGSHSEMEHKHGMKGSDRLSGANARKCTEFCVKGGSQYVLYDPTNKMTYQLSDQEKAKLFAGERVRIKGTYDESSKTITVESITRGGMRGMHHGASSRTSSSRSSSTSMRISTSSAH